MYMYNFSPLWLFFQSSDELDKGDTQAALTNKPGYLIFDKSTLKTVAEAHGSSFLKLKKKLEAEEKMCIKSINDISL